MYKGPFTYDDFFTIMPSRNSLLYIPEVACGKAATLLDELNSGGAGQEHKPIPFEFDLCVDPTVAPLMTRDGSSHVHAFKAVTRRQVVDLVPGYTTTDDFGSDGDDTTHSQIPYHNLPQFYQGAAGFGAEGCTGVADVVFVDLAKRHVLTILGPDYSSSDVTDYISSNYTTHDFLPEFVRRSDIFQAGMPDCIFA
ncbi:5'-nucleotidase [Hyaloscypha finlandica]|nr:5'-nucleotidase [Hyaloscypha finlandica]